MTSRERVCRTLEFRRPDGAPRDLGVLAYVRMFRQRELEEVLGRYPTDLCGCSIIAPGERRRGEEGRKGTYVDDWGCVWQAAEDGVAGEVKQPPLADWSRLAAYQPPWECIRNADLAAAANAQRENLASENPRFMMGGWGIRPFERMQFLRGTEKLLIDLAYDTAEVRRLRDAVHEFNLAELKLWCLSDIDGWGFMDDWGSQQSLLVSPGMWRAFFKPLYKEYCDLAHQAGKKIFFHSDGNILSIYQDLVELGIDAINSQIFAMDIEELGRRFKGKVTFWGEIDRQHVLPFGTVQDVRRAVGRVRRALDDPSGGVFAMCEWGGNVPKDNIQAVFDAWLEPIEQLPQSL